MAQENSPDKGKRQGRTKKPEKPYVEQIDELLLVHNKNDPKEIRQEFEYPRKLHQEFLEPAEGAYAFQAYPHDLQ